MKKVLSLLLCVMMVAGLFVALIPSASAAPATMAEPGFLVYSEDFEGDNLTDKTNNALTQELGWKQWDDSGECTVEGYMQGLNGRGSAAIETQEDGNKVIRLQSLGQGGVGTKYGDAHGWGIEICNNDRLAGGDYIIDYTATILSENDDSAARGIGWRNDRTYGYDKDWITSGATAANTGATYHVQIKSTGAYDMHLKATNGTTYSNVDSSSASLGSLIGVTNTYRTVVSSTEGIHTYVLKNGVWTYYFGMNANAIAQFAKEAPDIGAGLIMRVCLKVTATFDDIAVYTIKDESTPTVQMEGSQNTVADGDICDFRLVGTVTDSTDVVSAGFLISVNGGEEKKVYLNYAYASITTNYGNGTLTAPDGGFIGALEVKNCPADTRFSVKFFVEYGDGSLLISASNDIIYQ